MKLLFENWRNFIQLQEAISAETVDKITTRLIQARGEPYIVGGAIRDELMPDTPASKDVDFVVRNLTLSQIVNALRPLGTVKEVGQSFGVVTAYIDGEEFDFAIPRVAEKKTGPAHTDVEVETDPSASIESDLDRRDFTINAMAKDPKGRLIDLHGGQEDIANRVIRAVGDPNRRFGEDPLRMLRAIQFATRFNFVIAPDTAKAIKDNLDKISTISGERVMIELKKAWTKGSANSRRLIHLLKETGLGEKLFGPDFSPQPADIEGPDEDKMVGNFVAFFLMGGDYQKTKPSNEEVEYLRITQETLKGGQQVFEYVNEHAKDKLPLVAKILQALNKGGAADKIEHAMKLPVDAKELDINGRDLINLGLQGPEIGKALNTLMQAIYNGEIENEHQQLIRYLQT